MVNPPEPHFLERDAQERREKIYNRKESGPLGKRLYPWTSFDLGCTGQSYSYGHVLPAFTRDPNYRFGIISEHDPENHAKTLITPPGGKIGDTLEPTGPELEMYIKSHAAYPPGAQKDRHYVWDRIKRDGIFGMSVHADASGSQVKSALTWADDPESYWLRENFPTCS